MKKTLFANRVISVALSCMLLLTMLVFPASASSSHLSDMMDEILEWYVLIRKIGVFLLMLSFGMAGFKIMAAIFQSKGEFAIDAAKKQLLYSILALAVLIMLPHIIMGAIDVFRSTAWTPPSGDPGAFPTLPPATTPTTIPTTPM